MRTKTTKLISCLIMLLFFLPMMVLNAEIPEYSNALKKYKAKDYEGSLNLIRSVFDANRKSMKLRMLAAANYLEQGNIVSARDHLGFCIQDHPKAYQPRAFLASMNRRQGQPARSISISRRALRLTGDHIELRLELAASYIKLKKYKSAKTHLARALTLDPKSFDAVYMDGLAFLGLKNIENAEFRFRNALQMAVPGNKALANLYNNLGLVIERKADKMKAAGQKNKALLKYSESEKYFQKAIKVSSSHLKANKNLKRVNSKLES